VSQFHAFPSPILGADRAVRQAEGRAKSRQIDSVTWRPNRDLKNSPGRNCDTRGSEMPSTRTWIHALPKDDLIKALITHRLDTSGSIDELRKRLKTFAEHNPEWFSDTAPEPEKAQIATMTDKPPDTSPPLGETMNLVRKWGCRFTGKDPLAFLERVEELRSGYGLTYEQLLRCLPELISGEPLLWYRNNREF